MWCAGSRIEKTVRVGSQLSIPCELGSPGGSLRWLQNGRPVVLDARASTRRHWNVSREGVAALTIGHVTRADEGVWECQEIRPDGSVRKVAEVLQLSVAMPPEDPYLEVEGRRLVHQATLTVTEHQPISVRCIVRGAVPPARAVGWALGSANLTARAELFVEVDPSDDTFTTRSVLVLNVSREEHRRELICRVSHVTWLSSSAVSASVNVLYVPSFSITREPGFGHPVLEGAPLVLRCEVDSNPPSPPRWVRQEAPALPEASPGVLNFTAVRREHAGWYRCATDHTFGHFTSYAYFLNVRCMSPL
ncbi:Immunoglobulin [Cordylochernes scorpioides]|uniref:Immunoglobulin n=1 Tax=Cordylochernes scorpioides TaxID=51811 RepID=A0ABY6K112_9ARAC|nr:Immunoglobulin [Cordylochernes scorpioides]